MKVNSLTTKFVSTATTKSEQNSHKSQVKTQEKNWHLPMVDTVGRSMVSFGVKNKKKEIDVEKFKSGRDSALRKKAKAQAKLKEIETFNYEKERRAALAAAQAEIKAKGLGIFNIFAKQDIRNKHLNAFYEKAREIERLKKAKPEIKDMLDTCNETLERTGEEIRLGEIVNVTQKAQDAINVMLNGTGGLNERIAGYGVEKDKVTRMLVEPIQLSKKDETVKVPPAIMLYGATGVGKTAFLDAIVEQIGDVVVDNMTESRYSEVIDKDFQMKLRNARDRYLKKVIDPVTGIEGEPQKKRTLLVINEAEKMLAMTPEYAQSHLEYDLTASDYALLKAHAKNTELDKNVNLFKAYFDHCSQAPVSADDVEKGALTVFITTNYPHLIHPDLLTRDGKLLQLALYPAYGSNIEAVLKHYTTLNSNALEALKKIHDDSGYDMLAGLSRKSKETLKQYRAEGKLDKLKIDVDEMPYEKIAVMFKPTQKLGAFSNDRYRKVSEEAFINYLENPEIPYKVQFSKVLMREKRDIGPKRYAEFQKIYKLLEPTEVSEREELIRLEKMDALDEEAKMRLGFIRTRENAEKSNLQEKMKQEPLTKAEEKRLKEIEENQRKDKLSEEDYLTELGGADIEE